MTWVKDAKSALEAGEEVSVRPIGGSMRGRIESGQRVTIAPVNARDVNVDDVVFVRWKGGFLLHLVKRIDGERYLIGNALGKLNGWVSADAILGRVIAIEK
jgi:hypothetical protein